MDQCLKFIGVQTFFYQGGGKPFAQKILLSYPNFYETVERKQGSYDAQTTAYIWSENIFTYECIIWAQKYFKTKKK